jgi:nucleoid-associated protein YgaU
VKYASLPEEEDYMAQDSQTFERLKQKYQPALNLMQQLQVQLLNLNMQGSQLFIRAVAPSADAKNKIWDQIKLIDSSYSDLSCDISASQQQPTMVAGASVGSGQGQRSYTVQAGDTLSKISRQYYGDPNQYMKIFNANKSVLDGPNAIRAGQQLVIPD